MCIRDSSKGWCVNILSGDRDLFQLVDDQKEIYVLYMGGGPYAKSGNPTLMNENAVKEKLKQAKNGHFKSSEMKALAPTLEIQKKNSALPDPDQFLIETTKTVDGSNWFLFPFAGRLANEGLAALLSYRISKLAPMSLSVSFNDYGFHLCSNLDFEINPEQWRNLLDPEGLVNELLDCMNLSEMSKRQFREVARVAGLICKILSLC